MRIWLFLAFVCVSQGGAWAQRPPERVVGPSVRVGDTWMYNTLNGWTGGLEYISVNTVKEVTPKGIAIESASLDRSSVSTVSRTTGFNVTRIASPSSTKRFDPFYPNFSFPLQVGKSWRGDVTLSDSSKSGETQARFTGTAVRWESVTVPAGTFIALRVELRGTYVGDVGGSIVTGTIEDTLWYSPEIRNAVRAEYKDTYGSGTVYNHDVHELVRYWVAQQ